MRYKVKVSLKRGLRNPMFCVVCGGNINLYPLGFLATGYTNHMYVNYGKMFYFPVCGQCATKASKIRQSRKMFRSTEEKAFIKIYDQAVTCWLGYRPLLGINWARFSFFRKDYAEAFLKINREALI